MLASPPRLRFLLGVIVVAAGSGTRLGEAQPKALVAVAGRSILAHCLGSMLPLPELALIVVVVPVGREEEAAEIATRAVLPESGHRVLIVSGGRERQDSVAAGLAALPAEVELVLVHDAARMLTPATQFTAVIEAVRERGTGVVPALPVVDTLKRRAGGNVLGETVDRDGLAAVQTPQGFPRQRLEQAYARAERTLTDDAAVYAEAGFEVTQVLGHDAAAKITTPADLARAEALLAAAGIGVGAEAVKEAGGGARVGDEAEAGTETVREAGIKTGAEARVEDKAEAGAETAAGVEARTGDKAEIGAETETETETVREAGAGGSRVRTGIGIDTHAFEPGRELWLGGLLWPGETGLAGHSDGDALCHAIVDALLSAAGLGDIGSVFGTSDPAAEGAHGDWFLREALRLVGEAGWRIGNVAAQVIGAQPRVGPRRAELETHLTGILAAPVSVSATTTDGLGFTGRGEGVSVVATALLTR